MPAVPKYNTAREARKKKGVFLHIKFGQTDSGSRLDHSGKH